MAYWLIIIILSYLCFSIASLGDKLILSGFESQDSHAGSNPSFYAFSVGMLNILVLLVIPFVGFSLPPLAALPWIALEAACMILSLYLLYSAVKLFEVSKVVSIIGAMQPIFVYGASLLLFGFDIVGTFSLTAFFLLVIGSIIISFEKEMYKTKKFIVLASLASVAFALEYVSSKVVFLHMSFWPAMIWMRLFSFVFALFLLFGKNLRTQLFSKHQMFNRKTGRGFVVFQAIGASAGLLQSWAVVLVPVSYLAIMNSLRGVQYLFLFGLALVTPVFFPRLMAVTMSRREIIQKAAAMAFIVAGLAVLFLFSGVTSR